MLNRTEILYESVKFFRQSDFGNFEAGGGRLSARACGSRLAACCLFLLLCGISRGLTL